MNSQNAILKKLEAVEERLKAETPPPLNLKQAAKWLKISTSYLYKLTCSKKIPYFKPMGKLCYFNKADLDAFIFRNRQGTEKELEAEANNFIEKEKGGS